MLQLTYLNKKYPISLHWDKYNYYWFDIVESGGRIFHSIHFHPIFPHWSYPSDWLTASITKIDGTVVTVRWGEPPFVKIKTQDLIRVANMAHMHELFTKVGV